MSRQKCKGGRQKQKKEKKRSFILSVREWEENGFEKKKTDKKSIKIIVE